MRNLFILLLLLTTLLVNAQIETPPTGANFKPVPSYSFKHYTTDSTTWMYRGVTYGWMNLSRSKDFRYYRLLNNHDSLSKLQERSYHSLIDTPNLDLKANIASPTFTGTVTIPTLNIPTSAVVNYFWQCTNATTGAGTWASITTSATYKGTWNAAANTPTLADGSGTSGWFYRVTTGGTIDLGSGNTTFAVGDDAYYNGSIWQKVPGGITPWITSGSDIYYDIGEVGIGTTTPGQVRLKVLGVINDWASVLQSPNSTGQSYGLNVVAGTNSTDYSLAVGNAAGTADYFWVKGDGAVNVSSTLTSKFKVTHTGVSAWNVNSASDGTWWFMGVEHDRNLYIGRNNTNDITIENGSGEVGIGTTTPGTALDVNGVITATSGNSTNWNTAYTHSQIAGGNSVHVSTTENTQWDAAYSHSQIAGGNSVHVSTTENTNWDAAFTHSQNNSQAHSDYLVNNANDGTTGTLTATNFILSSDKRLKKNITPIKKAFNLKFVQFNLKSDPNQLRYGVLAQDVETYYPELVRNDVSGTKSVAYIDLLIGKIHELELRIEQLEKDNETNKLMYKTILNER